MPTTLPPSHTSDPSRLERRGRLDQPLPPTTGERIGTPLGRPIEPRRSSVFAASAWMVLLSLALFFVPVLNGLIAGFVGGMKVGSVRRALIAAVLPAIVVAVGLWILLSTLDAPFLGFLAGIAVGVWVLLSDLGLFVGAALGGASARSAQRRALV